MIPDLWYALIPVTIFAIIIWVILRKSGYCKYGCPFLARHAKPNTSKTTGGGRRNGRNGRIRRNHVTGINNHSKHRRDSDQDPGQDCDRISTISDGHCGYDGSDNGGGGYTGGTEACDNWGGNTGGYSGGGDTGGGGSGGGGYSGQGESGGCDAGGDGGG